MKMFLKISFLLLISNLSFSQKTDSIYTFLFKIDAEAKFFTVDRLQQVYVIDQNDEVVKFDQNGKEIFRYGNTGLGNLKSIDVTDPFNVLLYYPDYFSVLILDRTLNLKTEINLLNFGLENITAIGLSGDNNIWVFDEIERKLKKIDKTGNILNESEDLSLFVSDIQTPDMILEREQYVFTKNATGILLFDSFGHFIKIIDLPNINSYQIYKNQILYLKNDKLFARQIDAPFENVMDLPLTENEKSKVVIQKNRLFIFETGSIYVYEIVLK